MFFKSRVKSPLEQAIGLIEQATEIAYQYQCDKNYKPNESDLILFERLCKALWENHCTMQYIERNMGQRFRGEPEGSKKFTDTAVFDYHYP